MKARGGSREFRKGGSTGPWRQSAVENCQKSHILPIFWKEKGGGVTTPLLPPLDPPLKAVAICVTSFVVGLYTLRTLWICYMQQITLWFGFEVQENAWEIHNVKACDSTFVHCHPRVSTHGLNSVFLTFSEYLCYKTLCGHGVPLWVVQCHS